MKGIFKEYVVDKIVDLKNILVLPNGSVNSHVTEYLIKMNELIISAFGTVSGQTIICTFWKYILFLLHKIFKKYMVLPGLSYLN